MHGSLLYDMNQIMQNWILVCVIEGNTKGIE
jgi:hypothetical protein